MIYLKGLVIKKYTNLVLMYIFEDNNYYKLISCHRIMALENKTIAFSHSLGIEIKTVDQIVDIKVNKDFKQIYFNDGLSALIKSNAPILRKLKSGDRCLTLIKSNAPIFRKLKSGDRCLIVGEGGGRYEMIYGPIEDDKLHIKDHRYM